MFRICIAKPAYVRHPRMVQLYDDLPGLPGSLEGWLSPFPDGGPRTRARHKGRRAPPNHDRGSEGSSDFLKQPTLSSHILYRSPQSYYDRRTGGEKQLITESACARSCFFILVPILKRGAGCNLGTLKKIRELERTRPISEPA